MRVGILVVVRLLLGLAESLFLTGAMTWTIARVGAARTGHVISWQDIALYAALGLGAPLSVRIRAAFGFTCVALFVVVTPLAALAPALSHGGAARAILPPTSARGIHRPPRRPVRERA